MIDHIVAPVAAVGHANIHLAAQGAVVAVMHGQRHFKHRQDSHARASLARARPRQQVRNELVVPKLALHCRPALVAPWAPCQRAFKAAQHSYILCRGWLSLGTGRRLAKEQPPISRRL